MQPLWGVFRKIQMQFVALSSSNILHLHHTFLSSDEQPESRAGLNFCDRSSPIVAFGERLFEGSCGSARRLELLTDDGPRLSHFSKKFTQPARLSTLTR
jgi:hypothetical protein